MKQSVIKLVDVILQKIEEQQDVSPSESGLRSWLTGQGYNKRDIDAALKLVRPCFSQKRAETPRWATPVRLLSGFEERKLGPDARDALTRLELYQLIDTYERELILDQVAQYEGVIGLDELDCIVSWAVCGFRDIETQQTIYSVLDGTKKSFH